MEHREIRPDERTALAESARLAITLAELNRRLDGMIDLEFGDTQRRFTSYHLLVEPGVMVAKADIDRALAMRTKWLTLRKRSRRLGHNALRRLCLGLRRHPYQGQAKLPLLCFEDNLAQGSAAA